MREQPPDNLLSAIGHKGTAHLLKGGSLSLIYCAVDWMGPPLRIVYFPFMVNVNRRGIVSGRLDYAKSIVWYSILKARVAPCSTAIGMPRWGAGWQ